MHIYQISPVRLDAQPPAPEANAKVAYRQQNQKLTKTKNPVFDTSLAKIVQKYTDLAELVKVWPELPEYIKAAIKALVRIHVEE